MKKYFFLWLVCACLSPVQTVWADTEVLDVHFLPLNEAAELAQTQLSETGRVSALPSRRILVVEDDQEHIQKVKDLLKQLDVAVAQYAVTVVFNMIQKKQHKQIKAGIKLSGGWVQLAAGFKRQQSKDKQRFQLHVSAQQRASFEMGELRSYRKATRNWLQGYGLIEQRSVALIPITSGFNVLLRPASDNQVHVRLQPWMRQAVMQVDAQHYAKPLIEFDSKPNSKAKTNGFHADVSPTLSQSPFVTITNAVTELTIPIGKTISIIATHQEAQQLGAALLSKYSMSGSKDLMMSITVQRL